MYKPLGIEVAQQLDAGRLHSDSAVELALQIYSYGYIRNHS